MLRSAVENGHREVGLAFPAHGHPFEGLPCGLPCLACEWKVLELLIEAKARVFPRGRDRGWTAVHEAASNVGEQSLCLEAT